MDVGYVAVPIQRVARTGKEDGWYELRTIDDEVTLVCVFVFSVIYLFATEVKATNRISVQQEKPRYLYL